MNEKKTRPDTRLPQSRAGGQGPYLRSPDHLGRSSVGAKLRGMGNRAYWYEKNQWHWFGPLKHLCITSLRFQWCIIWSNCKNFRLSKILIFDEGKMHWNAQKSSDLDKAGFWSRRRRTLHGPKKVYFSWNSMWNLQTMPYSCEKNDEDGVKTCACSHRGPEWAFLAFEGLFNSFCTIVTI